MNIMVTEQLLISLAEKSLVNAKDLIDDAQILKAKNRLPRTYGLYQLSIEEVGKALICFLMLLAEDYSKITVKNLRDKIKDHSRKTYESSALNIHLAKILYKGNFEGALKFIENTIAEKNKLGKINEIKNYSFYTTVLKDKVSTPSEIIAVADVQDIEFRACSRFGIANAFISTGLQVIPEIKELLKENPSFSVDPNEAAKEFWEEILNK